MAQLRSCIAGFNVLNKRYVRAPARNQGLSKLEAQKIGYRTKKNTIVAILDGNQNSLT